MRSTEPGDETVIESLLLDTAARGHRGWRLLRGLALVLVVLLPGLGVWFSREPPAPDIAARLADAAWAAAPGQATAEALVANVESLLARPGGLLANDVLPPGSLLDDAAAFETGVMQAQRLGMAVFQRLLDERFPGHGENADLMQAMAGFRFDETRWAAPSAEQQYAQATAALRRWQAGAIDQTPLPASALAVACRDLAGAVEDQVFVLRIVAGELPAPGGMTPPEVDETFHGARGFAWALRNILAGLTLDAHSRLALLQHVDAPLATALAAALAPARVPVTLHGDAYGIFANHPRALAHALALVARELHAQAACLEVPEEVMCRPS